MILPRTPRRLRMACFILLLSMTPFLRSCGDVSYGFPFVAIEAGSPYAIKNIRPLLIPANAAVITLLIACAARFLRKKSILLSGGMQGVVFYTLCTWFGFIAIYPLSLLGDSSSAWGYITGIYLYFLYPFYAFSYDLHLIIPSAIEKSRFFGDADDIPLRIMYAGMMIIWFFLGYLRLKILNRKE